MANSRQKYQNLNGGKRYLSWKRYHGMINKLYEMIDWKSEEFDQIIAISRGGNIPGTILSHKTRLPLMVVHKGEVINVRGKLLIIDDISDTGSTLLKVISNLKLGTIYKIATLHMQPHTKLEPNYFVSITTKWVVYPYEKKRRS